MNKFEKYCWNKCIKDSFFGHAFLLYQQLCKFKKEFFKIFLIKYKPENSRRIQEFMGIQRYE